MRIAIFSNAYRPTISGVVTSISLFRRGLINAGHEVHIIAPEHDNFIDDEPYVFRLPSLAMPSQFDWSLAVPLKSLAAITVHGIKPDIIHSQHPLWVGDLAAAFAQDLNVPLVFTFHSRYDEYAQQYTPILPGLVRTVTKEILERYMDKCALVIAPSASIREFILNTYEMKVPITVVPTPVDLSHYRDLHPERIRAALGLEKAELLLYIGRLAREKNLPFLLHAFARVAAKRPAAKLLIVGGGPKREELARESREMGLADRVILYGAVPHHEVPHYAAAADLFVFPSLAETQGLVLVEAMAAGTPVVAVKAPGSMDILAEGGGVLVPEDEAALAQSIIELLDNPQLRRDLGQQALQVAHQYTIPSATARLLAAYETAIARGPRPG